MEEPIRYEITLSLSDHEIETIEGALYDRCEMLNQIATVNEKNGRKKMAAYQKKEEKELRQLTKKINDTFYRAQYTYYAKNGNSNETKKDQKKTV